MQSGNLENVAACDGGDAACTATTAPEAARDALNVGAPHTHTQARRPLDDLSGEIPGDPGIPRGFWCGKDRSFVIQSRGKAAAAVSPVRIFGPGCGFRVSPCRFG